MDTDKQTPSLPRWAPALLAALGECGVLSHACKQAGVDRRKVYDHRQTNPDLAARIEAARIRGGRVARAKKAEAAERKRGWQTEFLNALAETSNVLASAARAGVSHRKVYDTRRRSSTFAAKWQSALYEGYCNLEMEILGHLRDPTAGPKLDVANALRLLATHRQSAQREMVQRDHVSLAEVRASIARKVEVLRQQVAEDDLKALQCQSR